MDIKIAELFYNTDLDVGYIKNVHSAIKVGLFGRLEIYMVCKSCGNKEELIIR